MTGMVLRGLTAGCWLDGQAWPATALAEDLTPSTPAAAPAVAPAATPVTALAVAPVAAAAAAAAS
jgi:hypothetical protein